VPRLVGSGHEVHGMTRSDSKRSMLSGLGATPVVADELDPDQVTQAVRRAKPDVIVHQLTALAGVMTYSERDAAPTTGCGPKGRIACFRPERRWRCHGLSRRRWRPTAHTPAPAVR
jgi:NAD dependent epimerase/dehydratase family